jgi:hypothetical protein
MGESRRGRLSSCCEHALALGQNLITLTGFDVQRTYGTAASDASVGRRAGLKGLRGEGPESEPQRPFRCEREMAFTGNALARVGTAVHERPIHAFSADA